MVPSCRALQEVKKLAHQSGSTGVKEISAGNFKKGGPSKKRCEPPGSFKERGEKYPPT